MSDSWLLIFLDDKLLLPIPFLLQLDHVVEVPIGANHLVHQSLHRVDLTGMVACLTSDLVDDQRVLGVHVDGKALHLEYLGYLPLSHGAVMEDWVAILVDRLELKRAHQDSSCCQAETLFVLV